MIERVEIQSIGELIDFAFHRSYQKRIQRHLIDFVFRGITCESFSLASCLRRNSGANIDTVEKRILINFQKYGQIMEPRICNSVWENMIIAQHHAVPTRLLDWTYSPLVALHFATQHVDSGQPLDADAAIWAIGIAEANALLPPKYKEAILRENALAFTFDMLKSLGIDLDNFDNDMDAQGVLFFEPPSIDDRIANQYALFSILPRLLDPLDAFLERTPHLTAYKIIVPKDKLCHFRDELDIMNINERMLFPGLDGLAKWLHRRYYHRPARPDLTDK